jgi:6-phosphogluconolactonase
MKGSMRLAADPPALATMVAGAMESCLRNAVRKNGQAAVLLPGGNTPRAVLRELGGRTTGETIEWPHVHLFWGDERCVPPDHPQSNYRMVNEALLGSITIPEENIHRIKGEDPPETAAGAYEKEILDFFRLVPGEIPCFDLVLLGVGEDGHTASLFPGSPLLGESVRLVAATHVASLDSHRVTVTFPLINNAASVFILVSGFSKAEVVKNVVLGNADRYPVSRVDPGPDRLVWFADMEAVKLLPKDTMA